MAKKIAPAQLQADLNTDEEFENFLENDGLLLIEVYSGWCGPCRAMESHLIKIRLEYGGDILHLAIAKSDNITKLERFRDRSESTWMFIVKGKMVNILFGVDRPKLTRVLTDELAVEASVQSGKVQRVKTMEITELSEEEQAQYDEAQALLKEKEQTEIEKKKKQLHLRRVQECNNILPNVEYYGTILVFPNAIDRYKEVLQAPVDQAGLTIKNAEKVEINEKILEELLYFAGENVFPEPSVKELLTKQSVILIIQPTRGHEIYNIDDAILSLVYGSSKTPPGSSESPAQLLTSSKVDEAQKSKTKLKKEAKKSIPAKEQSSSAIKPETIALWAPPNPYVRAVSLKLFQNNLTSAFWIPVAEPTPPHIAIIFDQEKTWEAVQIMNRFPNEILAYGFFTSEHPETAQLVARNIRGLQKNENRTFTEKLVIQVAMRKSECIYDFAKLQPLYMSPNTEEGEKECCIFFPEEFLTQDEEVAEVESQRGKRDTASTFTSDFTQWEELEEDNIN